MSLEKLLNDISVDLSVDFGQGKSEGRSRLLRGGIREQRSTGSRDLADISGTDVEAEYLLTDQGLLIRDPDDKNDMAVGFQRLGERRWWSGIERVGSNDQYTISFGATPNANVIARYHDVGGAHTITTLDTDYHIETDADDRDVGIALQRFGERRWWIATNDTGETKLTFSYGANKHANVVIDFDGQAVGFFGATPQAQSTGWTLTNVNTDKTFDADSTSVAELADVLGTLIQFLIDLGLLGT